MYLSATRLPHLLSPRDYHEPARYESEIRDVFIKSWLLAATRADLPRSGDFLTCELFGRPLLLRNCDGEYRAAANVCAHRHCLITNVAHGNASSIRCQYHGWEYDADGRSTHIPQARSFVPLDAESRPCLRMYRTAVCGDLIFVNLTDSGPLLAEYLGEWHDFLVERFAQPWRQVLTLAPTIPANWKVAVENALESYHVPCVHPHTFKVDPGEERSSHRIAPCFTEFETRLPFSTETRVDYWVRRLEDLVMHLLGRSPTQGYLHVHLFPNLLFSFTDTLSLVQCMLPTSPTTSRVVVRQFGRMEPEGSVWQNGIARVWGRASALITHQILKEDFAFYQQIQRGLQASDREGMLGRCEERIYAFQKWLLDVVESPTADASAAGSTAADLTRSEFT